MGEIVNLRRARKARQKTEAGLAAEENRVRHGRTRAEKAATAAEEARAARLLDGARLGRGGEPRE